MGRRLVVIVKGRSGEHGAGGSGGAVNTVLSMHETVSVRESGGVGRAGAKLD